ncbi:hypothetical protein RFI_29075 [Reticulomyxa filosa]|uniref:Uncharacterized protein n=1 Tax=Reticulomyxa filosa TaxID=46433 RepID=X6M2B8_RETFI|nr:hypothetical protein RFI_29075 [Reticulomyxa filosa]|eukprot:ETO08313.1 hypothetical protein RFI_29075 [Reticulomyxa filosa]
MQFNEYMKQALVKRMSEKKQLVLEIQFALENRENIPMKLSNELLVLAQSNDKTEKADIEQEKKKKKKSKEQ